MIIALLSSSQLSLILEQVNELGFAIARAIAFFGDKNGDGSQVAPGIIHRQSEILAGQGFVPVVCYEIKEGATDATDLMIHDHALSYCTQSGSMTAIIVSGDKDFKRTYQAVQQRGNQCLVVTPSSNISESWLEESKAIIINLSPQEQEQYNFAKEMFQILAEGNLDGAWQFIESKGEQERLTFGFLMEVINAIPQVPSAGSYRRFINAIWDKLPPDWKAAYRNQDFLRRLVSLIIESTDIIAHGEDRTPRHYYHYNKNSQDIRILTGSTKN